MGGEREGKRGGKQGGKKGKWIEENGRNQWRKEGSEGE